MLQVFYLNVEYVVVATHMLQAYVPNISSVLEVCCSKSYRLQVFRETQAVPMGRTSTWGAAGRASSMAGMHAPMRVLEWGQPEGVHGRQPPDVGPVVEVGALECCHCLLIRFGHWRDQLTIEGGALRWLFGRTSASLQGRVRSVGRTNKHALG
jgi:hypothetical protein